jgi:hypothetical protein
MKTAVDKVKKGKGRVSMRASRRCARTTCSIPTSATWPPAGRRAWWRRMCRTAAGASGSMPRRSSGRRLPSSTPGWANVAGALWGELRHPEFKGFSVLEMLEQERLESDAHAHPFDGYVEKPARVSSTCLVSVARNRYSVPCELANQGSAPGCIPTGGYCRSRRHCGQP